MPDIFPFCPEVDYKDIYEFQTDVMSAYSSEQRQSLRAYPKRYAKYEYFLTSEEYAYAVLFTRTNQPNQVYVPLWGEHVRVNSIDLGATSISLDTTRNDYAVGDKVFLWESESVYEVVTVSSVSDTTLGISATTQSYVKVFVMPCRLGYISDAAKLSRSASNYSTLVLSYAWHEDRIQSNTGSLAYDVGTFNSKDVLSSRSIADSVQDVIDWDLSEISGINSYVQRKNKSYPRYKTSLKWATLDRDESISIKKFISSKLGKQKSFYLPDYNNGLILTADISSSDTTFEFEYVGGSSYATYAPSAVFFEKTDGTQIYKSVTTLTSGSGVSTLSFGGSAGFNLLAADCAQCGFMYLVRFDTDRFEFNHGSNRVLKLSANVIEVTE